MGGLQVTTKLLDGVAMLHQYYEDTSAYIRHNYDDLRRMAQPQDWTNTMTKKPWGVYKSGKLVERCLTKGEAIEEATWAIAGEGFDFNDKDDQAVYLDLVDGYDVVGWSVARIHSEGE